MADSDARVLITGASGAIGAALAKAQAGPGVHLILQGRDTSRLHTLADACQAGGATTEVHALDLADSAEARAWMQARLMDGVPDRVVFNAGVNTHIGPTGAGEDGQAVQQLMAINLTGVMAMVDPLAAAMRERGAGQLVFIGSLAGDFGLAVTPAYSASKAGLRAYAEALRGWLRPAGVRVNLVLPGYVRSAMSEAMPGPKPGQCEASEAARRILSGLERDQAVIRFPWWLALGTGCLRLLPMDWSLWLLRRLGYAPPAPPHQ